MPNQIKFWNLSQCINGNRKCDVTYQNSLPSEVRGRIRIGRFWLPQHGEKVFVIRPASKIYQYDQLWHFCNYCTLIKNKIKFTSYIRNSEWSSCKVIYEEGLPNIWGNAQIFKEAVGHIWLCNWSILNFLIYQENFLFYQCMTEKLQKKLFQLLWISWKCFPRLLISCKEQRGWENTNVHLDGLVSVDADLHLKRQRHEMEKFLLICYSATGDHTLKVIVYSKIAWWKCT